MLDDVEVRLEVKWASANLARGSRQPHVREGELYLISDLKPTSRPRDIRWKLPPGWED